MTILFTYAEGSIFLRLIIAHLLTDFFLQPDKWVADKEILRWRSKYLWLHGLVTGVACWILLADPALWWAALAIAATHTIIDGFKLMASGKLKASGKNPEDKARRNLHYFIADQLAHLLVIAVVWLLIINGFKQLVNARVILSDYKLLLRLSGYLFVLGPVGYCVGFFTKRWSDELSLQDSLKDVGKWIGMLERLIILTLVFINQFAAIGFLIAAKSLLRLIDKPDAASGVPTNPPFSPRKHTEYVLIGTFLSFSIALITGMTINYLIGLK